jgi:hypothetical protein
MTELTADTFNEICRAEPVQVQLAASEANHAKVQRTTKAMTWMVLAIVLVAAAVVYFIEPTWIIGVVILGAFGLLWARNAARSKAASELKTAILPHIAERAGLTYTADPDEPEGFAAVRKTLFGSANRLNFHDGFAGLIDGREAAFYEAHLQQVTHGKNSTTHTIFQGQIYWFRRRTPSSAKIIVVPDKGLFNFFKPERGMERVKFEGDRDFEKRFEVYSDNPAQAEITLGSSDLRAWLLQLRGKGALFLQIDGDETLVAVPGPNRFEPGDMSKKAPGEERARRMFDDLCACLTQAKQLSARLA